MLNIIQKIIHFQVKKGNIVVSSPGPDSYLFRGVPGQWVDVSSSILVSPTGDRGHCAAWTKNRHDVQVRLNVTVTVRMCQLLPNPKHCKSLLSLACFDLIINKS